MSLLVALGVALGVAPAPAMSAMEPSRSSLADPELVLTDATLELVDLETAEEEFVRFSFNRTISEASVTASDLYLTGVAVDGLLHAVSTALVEDQPNELVVGFPAGSDLFSYSVAGVEHHGVATPGGRGIAPGTVPLDGPTSGLTGRSTAVELVDVDVDTSLDRARFRFDEQVRPASVDGPSAWFLVTRDGSVHHADTIVDVDEATVVVEFPRNSDLHEATRLGVLPMAVRSDRGARSVGAVRGTATAAPDIVAARRRQDDGSQYLVELDETVMRPDRRRVHAITVDGHRLAASFVNRTGPRTFIVTFRHEGRRADDITLLEFARGFTLDVGAGTAPSTATTVAVGPGDLDVGLTSGPDLVQTRVQSSTGEVAFTFDEELARASGMEPARFHLITSSGQVVHARRVIVIDDEAATARIQFDEDDAATAIGSFVDIGAVDDRGGSPNPPAGIRLERRGPGSRTNERPTADRRQVRGRIGAPGCVRVAYDCSEQRPVGDSAGRGQP